MNRVNPSNRFAILIIGLRTYSDVHEIKSRHSVRENAFHPIKRNETCWRLSQLGSLKYVLLRNQPEVDRQSHLDLYKQFQSNDHINNCNCIFYERINLHVSLFPLKSPAQNWDSMRPCWMKRFTLKKKEWIWCFWIDFCINCCNWWQFDL